MAESTVCLLFGFVAMKYAAQNVKIQVMSGRKEREIAEGSETAQDIECSSSQKMQRPGPWYSNI